MPDERKHRGAHPADAELFRPEIVPTLRTAVAELSWLLSRGYSPDASLKVVGDRHALRERQRMAVRRAACSDQDLARRLQGRQNVEEVRGRSVAIDGFNLIITMEAALSGGVLLLCRDTTVRDLSSVHGSYRSVDETERALQLIGETLSELGVLSAGWFFDKPISNSGRLAAKVREIAQRNGWNWISEVTFYPDQEIAASNLQAITADSSILDRQVAWVPFVRYVLDRRLPDAWILNLT